MVTNGCAGVLRLARAFTRTSLRMTVGESIAEIADIARDRVTEKGKAFYRNGRKGRKGSPGLPTLRVAIRSEDLQSDRAGRPFAPGNNQRKFPRRRKTSRRLP